MTYFYVFLFLKILFQFSIFLFAFLKMQIILLTILFSHVLPLGAPRKIHTTDYFHRNFNKYAVKTEVKTWRFTTLLLQKFVIVAKFRVVRGSLISVTSVYYQKKIFIL
jgi:hypothetical protein